MARSIWNGSISFGLVNIPINLTAATESHRVGFHELERGTNQRIRYRRIAEGSGHEVPWEKIEKGFEVAKGRYVMLSDDELEAAAPRKSHTIDIERFVPLGEIDPINWDQSYFVAPDGEAAAKAYGLLRQAMDQHRRVAIGRFVMRTKEYVVCIRPFENAMALHTMYFADEVRSVKDLGFVPRKATAAKHELALAGQLIESLAGDWDPTAYKDTFKQRVMELVRKKDKGQEITATAGAPAKGHVIDLMEALKATLAAGKGKRGGAAGAEAVQPAAGDGGKRKPARAKPETRAQSITRRKPARRAPPAARTRRTAS